MAKGAEGDNIIDYFEELAFGAYSVNPNYPVLIRPLVDGELSLSPIEDSLSHAPVGREFATWREGARQGKVGGRRWPPLFFW